MPVNQNLVAFESEVIGLRRANAEANLAHFPSDASIPRVYGRPAPLEGIFGRFIDDQVSIFPVGRIDEKERYGNILQIPYSENIVDKEKWEDVGVGIFDDRREYQTNFQKPKNNPLEYDEPMDKITRVEGGDVRGYAPPAYLTLAAALIARMMKKTPKQTEADAYQQSLGVNRAKYIAMGAAEALARQPSVVISTRIEPFEPVLEAE